MKTPLTLFYCSLIFCGFAVAQNPAAQSSGSTISQIQSRIENGDPNAIEEAAKLPTDQAVDLLGIYALDRSNKVRAEQAREALRNLPGLSGYTKQQLLKLRSKPAGEYETGKIFDLLAVVGGDNAAAAVSPFLFVDDPPVLLSADVGTSPIYYQAVMALANMHLPDRPVDKEYYDLKPADIEAWKAWAIRKGYKDNSIPRLMTFEQKGVPRKIIAQTEAALAEAKADDESHATSTPQSTPYLVSPTPRPTVTPSLTMGSKKAASQGLSSLLILILIGAIAGATVFLIRRKS